MEKTQRKSRENEKETILIMGFKEKILQQMQQQNNDREQTDFPSNHLKNQELFFPKSEPGRDSSVLIRILPPADPDGDFGVQMREIPLQTKNRNGKDLKLRTVLKAFPDRDDELDQALVRWQANSTVPNLFSPQAKPSTRYLTNVVKVYRDQQGNYVEEKDANGNLVVRVIKLPYSAYQEIIGSLVDDLMRPRGLQGQPEEIAQFSFISSIAAYPIRITKPQKGSGKMAYSVQIAGNMELGTLPQGWENELEDLSYQATPTMQYNGDYARYFISVADGNEESFNESRNGSDNSSNQSQNQNTNTGATPYFGRDPQPQGQAFDPTDISDEDLPFNMQAMPDVPNTEQGQGQGQGNVNSTRGSNQPQVQPQPQAVNTSLNPVPDVQTQSYVQPQGQQQSQQPNQPTSGDVPSIDELIKNANNL